MGDFLERFCSQRERESAWKLRYLDRFKISSNFSSRNRRWEEIQGRKFRITSTNIEGRSEEQISKII